MWLPRRHTKGRLSPPPPPPKSKALADTKCMPPEHAQSKASFSFCDKAAVQQAAQSY